MARDYDNDPRLKEIMAAAKLALQRQDELATINDPDTRDELAGEALYALNVIVYNFTPAIGERFRSELPADTRKSDPNFAKKFQRAVARVWRDVMEGNVPLGVMVTHGHLRLSEGDQPELYTRAARQPDTPRSSKPMSIDMDYAKRMLVLRAYHDGSYQGRAALVVLAQYIKHQGADLTNLKKHWTRDVPEDDRALAAAAGQAARNNRPLTPEQTAMRDQVMRFTPDQLLAAYQNLGGTPR